MFHRTPAFAGNDMHLLAYAFEYLLLLVSPCGCEQMLLTARIQPHILAPASIRVQMLVKRMSRRLVK